MKHRAMRPQGPPRLLGRVGIDDAELLGAGECEQCKRFWPRLFLHVHTKTEKWFEEHDECPDCFGHEEEDVTIVRKRVCAPCYSKMPEDVLIDQTEEEQDHNWRTGVTV